MEDLDLKRLYDRLEDLRKEIKENSKAMEYYNWLKDYNRGDKLYGWLFDNNSILEDTLEDLNIYQKPYVLSVLQVYVNELENILIKVKEL